MEQVIEIDRFLDDERRITRLPRKQTARLAVLKYLTEKFEFDRVYTEHQVNEICSRWHTFEDFFVLRRELVESRLLCRKRDGSEYWRPREE